LEIPELIIVNDAVKLDNSIINAVIDKDGQPSIAIQIVSNLDDFTYDSNNGVIKVDRDTPGQDIVYLSLHERLLTIYHKGFKPKNLILRQVGITPTPRSMWRVEVSGHNRGTLNEKRGTSTLRSTPSGAQISISGYPEFQASTPYTLTDYIAQPYQITVSKPYFDDIDTVLIIGEGENPPMNLRLKTTNAGLDVVSKPPGAKIYLGETYMGQTPIELVSAKDRVAPGTYELRLVHEPFYKEVTETVSLLAGSLLKRGYILDDMSGYLTFTGNSFPVSATINEKTYSNINNKETIRLPAGDYNITIIKEGKDANFYDQKRISRTLQVGANLKIDASLHNRATWIRIEDTNVPLDISTNDNIFEYVVQGDTIKLEEGMQTINLTKSGSHKSSYADKESRLALRAYTTHSMRIDLEHYTGFLSVYSTTKRAIISVYDLQSSSVVFSGVDVSKVELSLGDYEVSSKHFKYADSPSERISIAKDKHIKIDLTHALIESEEWQAKRSRGLYNPRSIMLNYSIYRLGGEAWRTKANPWIKADGVLLAVEQTFNRIGSKDKVLNGLTYVFLSALDEFSLLYLNSAVALLDLRMLGVSYQKYFTSISDQLILFLRFDLHTLWFNHNLNIENQDYLLLSKKPWDNQSDTELVTKKYSLSTFDHPFTTDIGISYNFTPKRSNSFSIGATIGAKANHTLSTYHYYNKSQYDTWVESPYSDKYLEQNLPAQLETYPSSQPSMMFEVVKYFELNLTFDY